MEVSTAQRVRCADCGASGDASDVSFHLGASSARHDEGHVKVSQVPLCAGCAGERLAEQEENPLFG